MPDIVDVFGEAPFRPLELTNQIELITPRPTLLGTLGTDLFRPVTSWTGNIAIYQTEKNQRLIGTSPTGSPPEQLEQVGGRMRQFGVHRIAKASTLQAISLRNILQQPLFQAVRSMQEEISRRSALIRDDFELTWEYHRLGAVMCRTMDADGATQLHNWYDEWGVAEPADFSLGLADNTVNLRVKCRELINRVKDASRGSWVDGVSRVHVLCADDLFTDLISHEQVEKTYLGYVQAAELRDQVPDRFNFGGVVWHDYRQALDPRFGIASGTGRYFPVGAGDTFQHVLGPGEFPPYINNPGRKLYNILINDKDRGAWVKTEYYSHPLFINMRPEMCGKVVA